jgi:GT2 family glycosyltransferase
MGRVCVGTPALERPAWAFVESLLFLDMPGGWTFRRAGPLAVDMARNEIVSAFLASRDEWLLLVDSDAVLHRDTVKRLLSWGQPVVSALAFMRYGALMPSAFRGRDGNSEKFLILHQEIATWLEAHQELYVDGGAAVLEPRPDDALLAVDRVGCHCLLVHRDALAAVEPPWFVGQPPKGSGEDFFFCDKLQQAGVPIYVDRSVVAGHLYGERPLGALDFMVWRAAAREG